MNKDVKMRNNRYAKCVDRELNPELFNGTYKFLMNNENTYKITRQISDTTVEMLRDDGEISNCKIDSMNIFELVMAPYAEHAEIRKRVEGHYCVNTIQAFYALVHYGIPTHKHIAYRAEATHIFVIDGEMYLEGFSGTVLQCTSYKEMTYNQDTFYFNTDLAPEGGYDIPELKEDPLPEEEVAKHKQDCNAGHNGCMAGKDVDGVYIDYLKSNEGVHFKHKAEKALFTVIDRDANFFRLENIFSKQIVVVSVDVFEESYIHPVQLDRSLSYMMKEVSGVPELQDYLYTIVDERGLDGQIEVTIQGIDIYGNVQRGKIYKDDFWYEYRVVETTQELRILENNLTINQEGIQRLYEENLKSVEKINAIKESFKNPFVDFQRVHAEGALIVEVGDILGGDIIILNNEVDWTDTDRKLRIKGGISIPTWDACKDAILAFWDGKEVLKKDVTTDGVDHWYTVKNESEFDTFTTFTCTEWWTATVKGS